MFYGKFQFSAKNTDIIVKILKLPSQVAVALNEKCFICRGYEAPIFGQERRNFLCEQ